MDDDLEPLLRAWPKLGREQRLAIAETARPQMRELVDGMGADGMGATDPDLVPACLELVVAACRAELAALGHGPPPPKQGKRRR